MELPVNLKIVFGKYTNFPYFRSKLISTFMKNLLSLALLFGLLTFLACSKNGDLDLDSTTVATANPTLSANFSINNPNSKVDEKSPVLLSNLSSQAVAYHWDFGNGSTSTDKTPAYAYEKCGIYTITLTVTGADGTIKKAQREITSLCIFGGVHSSN